MGLLAMVWEGVKGLFGGKGTTQIGKGNQSVATGDNSPVFQAGRDVHVVPAPPPIKDEDAEMFADLEQTMPDLLNTLRQKLAENPLLRNIVIVHPKIDVNHYSTNWIRFTARDSPNIQLQLNVLENNGLVSRDLEETRVVIFGDMYRNAFVMSERLARYLKKGKASPSGFGTGG
jgi:hypothetical protein